MQRNAQSAMEYLMTYGWAILIIAIVLAAMFQFGFFNSNTYSPKAPPGACSVYRPEGQGSTRFIGTEGVCSSAEPEYVAKFNGQSSVVQTQFKFPSSSAVSFTVTAWIKPETYQPYNPGGIIDADNGNNGWGLYYFDGDPGAMDFWILGQGYTQDMEFGSIYPHRWTFVAVNYTYSGGSWYANGFVDGALVDANVQRAPVLQPIPFGLELGQIRQSSSYMYNGSLSNVQVYDSALSTNQIDALYSEGIGGVPINIQNLVAWWPLNGDTNDYSGDGYNGTASNVYFTNSWESGYTPS